ncbi:Beta-ketoacyl synthase [Cordyceps fumosorosea ARSEF 2679]|uniref:Fumosorinone synthetase n=1 Tax=Cordyceps fumosorosea (strain ARSEF 2679) TaxID=1081104 RepID=FUMOS_CORFA|nr:Beta-ketoacyl synthase [Cordyceps fumosorosea ARSEF 2679]A0A167LUQ4.1 RecName: Full=Fumosorinone synthetase; AltName: Full=Fumosorinone biosynthesis cluster protein B; AltName: Full=Hybrid PKS-NRPS synthetase fumoS [Cordyceps fumosorosea ARSEF 2679]AKC54422.1 fumosorinone biosynthesis polyketide synthase [Cordyceps fumosorosea]OAA53529.1 Beta-ketoacyl synthase [Cordyceps fumosorosea ARSEF 2679]
MSPTTQHEPGSPRVPEPIAIVGSACRFPGGSSSPSKLWDLLREPRDVLRELPPERLNLNRYYHPDGERHGSTNVANRAYVLDEDVARFDAGFFGISPLEAAGMDPQQRLLLEVVHEATEAAGIPLAQLRGSPTSVHVGVMTNDWSHLQRRDPETMPRHTATGAAASIIANRVSYVFDLRGASETIDTACSSSLVALHSAARALRAGDCTRAVVAGVNLILDPDPFVFEAKLGMLSPGSRSRMWDKEADGYARGEGVAAVVLKTLRDALRDGDEVAGVVRATGVNSDGTGGGGGLTMPSAEAQTALIRRTYEEAGLDPVADRPQFFECHGTGTKAGDPVEARAISEAFVKGHRGEEGVPTVKQPLYVGSIKTVVGHLEGCAGLAGVIKVLLSLKHGVIPPNLLFNELNPDIAQYYGPLNIPTKAKPWPKLAPGVPLRASVNSFGFGGTNAHAIIERYDATQSYVVALKAGIPHLSRPITHRDSSDVSIPAPILLSARTGGALWRTVDAYARHLRQHPELSLADLSRFLHERRSTHRVRAHFSGASREALLDSMDAFVRTHAADAKSAATQGRIGHAPLLIDPKETPGVLGVFTGQGAQWPAMGRDMMRASPLFRRTIAECEGVLRALPGDDAPEWSLAEELTKEAPASRLAEAAIAQPLCTAVQLALVGALRAAGLRFDAVVGHSSGEIAATYAAGIITLQGAMQIAYYRGFHAKLARGPAGEAGGMLAVGLSPAEARELCARPEFTGRLQVAACNAPKSVTLSGDKEVVAAAREMLVAQGAFARELRVDTAYHSHHMLPCAAPYLESIRKCDVQVSRPTPGTCQWSSSVRGDAELLRADRSLEDLKGPYWVANMVQTVQFSRALEASIWHGGPFDLAVEVGPHPALKGPTEQTLKGVYGSVPFYTGVLKRDAPDAVSFSTAIGSVWAHLGPDFVDVPGYCRSVFSETGHDQEGPVTFVPDLPAYAWDHEETHWRESRISKRYRTGRDGYHELLGRRAVDDNEREVRWRNLLAVRDLPWTRGHTILGEVLLPGAAYVSMALEAGRRLAEDRGREARLLEVSEVDILRPVVVADGKDATETLFTVRILKEDLSTDYKSGGGLIKASFSFCVYSSASSTAIAHTCEGLIDVHLGPRLGSESEDEGSVPQLPQRQAPAPNLQEIDCEKLYAQFGTIGLEYSGIFRRMTSSRRHLGHATASASWAAADLGDAYMVHPAVLDVAFQTIFVAHAHPDSGQVNAALLPSRIERVRVAPSPAMQRIDGILSAEVDSWILHQTATSVTGNLDVHDADTGAPLLQVEGFEVRSVGERDAAADRLIFAETAWGPDVSVAGGLSDPIRDEAADATVKGLAEASERVSLFYARRLMAELSAEDRARASWYHERLLQALDHHLERLKGGVHPHLRAEWLADDDEVVRAIDAAFPKTVELQMLHAVGRNMASVVRGEKHMLEVMRVDNMLDRFYAEDKGMQQVNIFLANAVKEISFKFPRCKILEIGAGTGATTSAVLHALDDAFDTYTYTDLSVGFFETAMERFADSRHKMVFAALDVEKDLASQPGFAPHSYDLIIAANVLHATRDMAVTLRNVRALLRPGGYLVLNEHTGAGSLCATFNFGGLEGWWLAEEEDRRRSPLLSTARWDAQLRRAGFSGADHVAHDIPEGGEGGRQISLIVSQAVDERFWARVSPLSEMAELQEQEEEEMPLLLIGGKMTATARIFKEVRKLLPRRWRERVRLVDCVDSLDVEALPARCDVICLQELDAALFATPMTPRRLQILQTLLMNTANLLWVTHAQTSGSATPRAAMFRGITRVMAGEIPQINTQVIGVEPATVPSSTARHLLEAFLRLQSEHTRIATNSDGDDAQQSALWSHEPEIDILPDGTVMIPRVRLNRSLNETYNASSRTVAKTVDASCVPVQAVAGPTKMQLQPADEQTSLANGTDSTVRVKVEFTLHVPQAPDGTNLYLVCGWTLPTEAPDGTPNAVLAVSTVNASIIEVPSASAAVVADDDMQPDLLLRIFDHLAAQAVQVQLNPTGEHKARALIYGADERLAQLISTQSTFRDNKVYFASSQRWVPDDWIKVHPLSSKFALSQALPYGVQVFIDCLGTGESVDGRKMIVSCLPAARRVRRLDASLLLELPQFSAALASAYSHAKSVTCPDAGEPSRVDRFHATELAGRPSNSFASSVYITSWQDLGAVQVATPPLETQGMFRSDRTYLMVGAAGGVGTSICRWMVRNGARHVVVTSRTPTADPVMLAEAAHHGADVRVLPMDVCDRLAVHALVDTIRATMPPIAGVCNAAMVLRDKLFLDMDVDILNDTLGPKVDGTETLDALFSDDAALDFFVLLGSAATVASNAGQANYHCANLYMDALVRRRRARGLAASIIHVGFVCETGYVARLVDEARALTQRDAMRVTTLSETDVHHAFAQAVRGGRPGRSGGSHSIVMGIEPPSKALEAGRSLEAVRRKALWLSDPRFGHMVPYSTAASQTAVEQSAAADASAGGGSVGQQVAEASTEEEAAAAVRRAFSAKLEGILLLPPSSIGEDGAGRPVTDLGIDSLVAVEIRTWFLKQLRVDVPVMKILGGSTIGQLSTLAAKLARQQSPRKEGQMAGKEQGLPSPETQDKLVDDKEQKVQVTSSLAKADSLTQEMQASAHSHSDSATNPTPSSTASEADDSNSQSTRSTSTEPKTEDKVSAHVQLEPATADHHPKILREAPMSAAQARIWFLAEHMAEPDAYNMVFHYRVRGPLHLARLRRALHAVAAHHECLRMSFRADPHTGQPMQGLLACSAFQMTIRDEGDVEEELRRLRTRAWRLELGETLEIVALPGGELLFGYHHIVMDGIGWAVVLADLDRAYRMLPLDKAAAGSHVEFSEAQRQQEREGALDEPLAFWQAEFETIPEPLPQLSVSSPQRSVAAAGTHRVLRELPPARGAAIRAAGRQLRVSPFHLHLAVLQVVLARLAGIEDVCVGIVDANRGDARAARMVGCFVNMLPVRNQVRPGASLAEVARGAASKALAAFANGAAPLDRILDRVQAPRPVGGTPLFQAALNYRPASALMHEAPLGAECRMELVPGDIKDADNPFEVSVLLSELPGGGLGVEMFCQKAVYNIDGSEALLDAYVNVLGDFMTDASQRVRECAVYRQADVDEALTLGKGPEIKFGWPATLSERVMNICQKNSARTAIKDGSMTLSYASLASKVNDVASAIVSAGSGVGSRIAVLCEPSVDAIVAMLAILHIGAVYVPLDISLPEARHVALVSNCTPSLIVCHKATLERTHRLSTPGYESAQELVIDDLPPSSKQIDSAPLRAQPDAPAILLYTSGTTGTPKGVLLTQANFANHIALKSAHLGLDRDEVILQQSSLGFDMSLVQIFCALGNGGCLVIVPPDARRDPVELTSIVQQHEVSLTIATPSEYLAWLQYGSGCLAQATAWRHLCMGGEPISQLLKDELRRLGRKNLKVTNCYGPTETTAAVSFQLIDLESDSCSSQLGSEVSRYAVGKPLANYSIRIMDPVGAWLPVNHTGEIVTGGAGVALGYLGLSEETRAKFVQVDGEPGRFYRTGDTGRLLPDGTLLCFGRIEGDSQVKLRGLRIELQEVEAAILQASEGLLQAAGVSCRGDMLVAHCTLSPGKESTETDKTALLRRLSEVLPQFAVPAAIHIVPSLPNNSNGKLDRKAIAALPLPTSDCAAHASSSEKMTIQEGELRLLWERVLPRDAAGSRITPASDFFLRGGNSLLLMKLQAAIRDAMDVRVPTRALYQASTLSGMTRCVLAQRERQRRDEPPAEDIDWAAEVAVPPELLARADELNSSAAAASLRPRKTTGGLEILLTGATGFLGGQLLRHLLRSPAVSRIHCVAVPADEREHLEAGSEANGSSGKVACHTGNLAAADLGLAAAQRARLAQSVDVIVHAGAAGHCLNTYATLSAPNLSSTKSLAALALARSPPIPLFFASSNRVVLLTGETAPASPSSVASSLPPADGAQGYTASKWASEVFLESLTNAVTSPWRVSIHRPCALVGDGVPNTDALNVILRYAVEMRCVPSLPRERARGYLDFGTVDAVVAEMAADVLALADEEEGGAGVRYRHHSGGVKVPIHEFRAHMDKKYGERFESVDLAAWIPRAVEAGMDPLISAYLETFLETDEPLIFPYMGGKSD